jgi:uncharacterized protein involved in exopolysaccharide biosynthesis
MDREELDLAPYIRAVLRRPWTLFICMLICGLLAAGLTYILKPTWRATAVLLMPMDSGSSNPLASLVKGDADPLQMLKGILESKASLDYLSERTGLMDRDVEKMMAVQMKKDENQLIVSFSDKNQDRALAMTQDALQGLAAITAKANMSQADRQAQLLEDSLVQKNKELKAAEDRLLFATQHSQTYPDPTHPFNTDYLQKKKEAEYELGKVNQQIDVALNEARRLGRDAMSLPTAIPGQEQLRQNLIRQQYELDTNLTQLGPTNPKVRSLQGQIEVTKRLIRSEVAKYLKAAQGKVDPALAQLEGERLLLQWQNDYLAALSAAAPVEGLTAARMFREVDAQQDAVKLYREKFEEAKLQAAVDPTHYSLLVPPYIEDRPTNKRFGTYSAIGAGLGLLFGCFLVIRRYNKAQRRGLTDESPTYSDPDGIAERATYEEHAVGVDN